MEGNLKLNQMRREAVWRLQAAPLSFLIFQAPSLLPVPLTQTPLRGVPSEGALSFTHTLIRTVSTAKTHFTHHQARKLHFVCLLFLQKIMRRGGAAEEERSGGTVKSLLYLLLCNEQSSL